MKRSSRDVTAARRDPGGGSARTPYPQAGRSAALHRVLHRDRRAGPGRLGSQRDHGRRPGRHRGRHQAGTGRAAPGSPAAGADRPVHPARGPGRPAPGPAPVPAAGRVRRHRRPGRRRDRDRQRAAQPGARQSALRRHHHGPPGHEPGGQPHPGPGPRPGRPGRIRHHGRPRRAAGLAERAVGGGRRVLRRARGRAAHADADAADHGDRGPRDRPGGPVFRGLHLGPARRPGHRLRAQGRRAAGPRDQAGPDQWHRGGRVPSLRGDHCGRCPGHRGVRPGPAGGGPVLPDLPLGAAARAGVARRPAVGGAGGRAPGAAVLRGRRRRRAHAAAAGPGPGRPRSRRARLRAPRRDHTGRAQPRVQRRGAQADLGRGGPAARPPGDPPGADRGPDPVHRGWPGHAARSRRRRRGSQRPADPPRRRPAPGRTLPLRRPGPHRPPRAGRDGRERTGDRGPAAAAGCPGPFHPQGAAPAPGCAAGAAHQAARGSARRRGRPGTTRAHPAAHPGDHGRRRRRGLPAGRRAGPGQPEQHAARGQLAVGDRRAGPVGVHLRGRHDLAVRLRRRPAELLPHPARPGGRLLHHPGDPGRRRRGRAEHQVPAAQEDPGRGRRGQRRRGPGRGVRPAHRADRDLRRDRGQLGEGAHPAAEVGLVRAGRPGRPRARGVRRPGRTPGAARPGVADARPGAAAAARGGAAAAQARPRHRRRAAAQPVLHPVPGRLRRRVRTTSAVRQHRRGLPDRQRHRLHPAHPGRPGRGGGGADRRAHRRGPAGRGRGQRGAAVPAADVLAAGSLRLGRDELPGARASPVTPFGRDVPWNGEAGPPRPDDRRRTTFPKPCD